MTTTTTTDWPDQPMLPGQTAAHPGPVDMTMMYVMHHAFRRDLAAFATAAGRTPATDRRAWKAMARRWELFSSALHHHHSGEDAGLWPALMDRADDEGRATLEAMEAEHSEIDPILQACETGFRRLAEHLEHEETEAIAMIQELLTQEEWDAISKEHFDAGITFGEILTLVPWVAHGLPESALRELFARPGGTMHKVMLMLTRRRFDRLQRAAFGDAA